MRVVSLQPLALVDVRNRAVQPRDAAVVDRPPAVADPQVSPVGANDAIREPVVTVPRHRDAHLLGDTVAVVGMHDARVSALLAVDQAGGRVAGDLLDRLAHELDRHVRIERAPIDGARNVGHEQPEAILARAQRPARALELGRLLDQLLAQHAHPLAVGLDRRLSRLRRGRLGSQQATHRVQDNRRRARLRQHAVHIESGHELTHLAIVA
jgi:hypothetical protein